jgi:hypothetical protein
MDYRPPKSVQGFLTSEKFVSLIIGPVGSTKTSAGMMKIVYHASKMAKCYDGIRRSRAVWVRNTKEQLRDSSIPDFLQWFPHGVAGRYEKSEYRFTLRFADIECEVLFRALDDPDDIRRLLSVNASFGIIEEFREIDRAIFESLQGRLGRYPSKILNSVGCVTDTGAANMFLWGMSNAPDMDTFWEQFASLPPDNAAVFIQPSGLSPEADWLHCLPVGYYDNLIEGKTQDWIDIYVYAKFGKTLGGRPVFNAFNYDIHVSQSPLRPLPFEDNPLLIGVDFGLTPAAVIGQAWPNGRLLVLAECVSERSGILQFVQNQLKPLLSNRFPACRVLLIGDPAGSQGAQTDEKSCFDILRAEKFKVIPARTNALTARLTAVEGFLTGMVDGKSKFLIDGAACPVLTRALRGGYRFKKVKPGITDATPDKNEYSHPADALQYLALHADGGRMAGGWTGRSEARPVKTVATRAWT